MYVRVLGFAVGFFVLGGCGTFVDATPLNPAPRALSPRPAEQVEVYASSPPTRPHVDIALIQADQINGSSADLAAMVAKLREKAGQMGCDALFVSGSSERAGAPGDAHLLDPGSHLLLATCVVYVAPGQGPTAVVVNTPPLASSAPLAPSAPPAPSVALAPSALTASSVSLASSAPPRAH